MSELNFNVKDERGIQRFITPLITVKHGAKVTILDRAIRLTVAYVIKALVEGQATFTDVTKVEAGAATHETLAALPADAMVSLYMPVKLDDRESDDVAKWASCVTVKMSDLAIVASVLTSCADVSATLRTAKLEAEAAANAKISAVVAAAKYSAPSVKVTQPLYFEGGKAKRSGGDRKISITLK